MTHNTELILDLNVDSLYGPVLICKPSACTVSLIGARALISSAACSFLLFILAIGFVGTETVAPLHFSGLPRYHSNSDSQS